MADCLQLYTTVVLLFFSVFEFHVAHGQVLEPITNQTVPINTDDNVTFTCTTPTSSSLRLLWEVDNLQNNEELFNALGIFIETVLENDTTLIFTEQALMMAGQVYEVQCVLLDLSDFSTTFSPSVFVRVFGRPNPVVNLDVVPFSDSSVLITWDRPPSTFSDVALDYTISIQTNVTRNETTTETSLEVPEPDMACQEHEFTVRARNVVGESAPVSIRESIPISPNLTQTDSSLAILSLDISSPSSAEISVSFTRATACNEDFTVTNHSVLVIGEDGEVVRRELVTDSSADLLTVTVTGLPRDDVFTVRVEACNVLLCRRSIALDLRTTDVQTASALFFETFIFLNCTFGAGSLARGCVFILQLEGEEGEVGRERFWLERQNGSSVASTQCNRTENSRIAYQVITAADWESDGTVGLSSIPVSVNVTDDVEEFPCPTEPDVIVDGSDDGLSGGAIAGIVIGTVVFVIIVMAAVAAAAFFYYYRTRDVKRKPNGAISIEERALLPSSERRNISSLGAKPPLSYLSVDTSTAANPGSPESQPTSSMPPGYSLQNSLDCGPVGELIIPAGKKGKIHMHIWSDTLERCKKTGKKSFQLIPLLDDPEPLPEIPET